MKSMILKRHDLEDEYDEALELSTEEDIIMIREESTLLSTLASPAGGYIIISFVLFIILFYLLDNILGSNSDNQVSEEKKRQ